MTKFKLRIRIPRTSMAYDGFGQYSDSFNTILRTDSFEAVDLDDVIQAVNDLFGSDLVSCIILGEHGGVKASYREDTKAWKIKEPPVREIRLLAPMDLRKLCIKNNWYTMGDNEQYGNLLINLTHHGSQNMTTADIEAVARDIMEHSDMDDDEDLCSVMYAVNEVCTTIFTRR